MFLNVNSRHLDKVASAFWILFLQSLIWALLFHITPVATFISFLSNSISLFTFLFLNVYSRHLDKVAFAFSILFSQSLIWALLSLILPVAAS